MYLCCKYDIILDYKLINTSKFCYLFLNWKRKGKCDNPSRKKFMSRLTFVYKNGPSLQSKLN